MLALRGAEGLSFSAAGSLVDRYTVGEYVTLTGAKSGSEVSVGAIAKGVHPGAASAPYFVAGGALLAMIALFFLTPLMIGEGGEGAGRLRPRFAPLRRLVRRERVADPDSEPPQETGDNRSGAPAPKG